MKNVHINILVCTCLNLLFPKALYCISCDCVLTERILAEERQYFKKNGYFVKDPEEMSICPDCMKELLLSSDQRCEKCGRILSVRKGKIFSGGNGRIPSGRNGEFFPERERERDAAMLCDDCMGRESWIARGTSCAEYKGAGKHLIHALKYGEKSYLAGPMGVMMEAAARKSLPDYDIVVPVPMFREKQLLRGYNQAELLAESLCASAGKPCGKNVLKRVRATVPLSGLSPAQRKKEIHRAIKAEQCEWIKGKRVLLADDVYTTGSTAEESSKALIQAGAEAVYFISFAATSEKSEFKDESAVRRDSTVRRESAVNKADMNQRNDPMRRERTMQREGTIWNERMKNTKS